MEDMASRFEIRFPTWTPSISIETVYRDTELGDTVILDEIAFARYENGRMEQVLESEHCKQIRLKLEDPCSGDALMRV